MNCERWEVGIGTVVGADCRIEHQTQDTDYCFCDAACSLCAPSTGELDDLVSSAVTGVENDRQHLCVVCFPEDDILCMPHSFPFVNTSS